MELFNSGLNDTIMNHSLNFRCNLPPFIPPVLEIPEAVNIVQAVIAVLCAVIGLPVNTFLFIIILKHRELHQRSLYLSLGIIFVEVVYQLVIPATILVSSIKGEWIFGEVVCNITGMIQDGFAMYRFTMTSVFTIDRFISVYKPFSKHVGIIAWNLSAIMWLITFIRVVLPLPGILDCYTYIPTFKTCTAFAGCSGNCKYFIAWSTGLIIITGVILPLLLYAVIFFIVHRIIKYHKQIQTSVTEGRKKNSISIEMNRVYNYIQHNKKKFITVSLLLISIVGTTPAFTLYMASFFYLKPNKVLFIANMLIGRTSFNLIPVFDSLAFTRHQDIKMVSLKCFRSLRHQITPESRTNQRTTSALSFSLSYQSQRRKSQST